MKEFSTVCLQLESRAQVLTLVRGMLSGMAEPIALDPELLDDLKTAVSEACNNVVLHAYGGAPGPMVVTLHATPGALRVAVTDRGVGVPEDVGESTPGIGLSVIRALAEQVTIERRPEGGTRLEMTFASARDGRALVQAPEPASDGHPWPAVQGDQVGLSVSPVRLLPPILGRMARTLAATAHFSLDRFSDVYLITDSLAAHAGRNALDGRVDACLAAADRRLEVEIGPLRPGTSHALAASTAGTRSPLSLLSDEVQIVSEGLGDRVRVVVLDRRA